MIVHRMRRHYRELIRDEIANTLNDPREVDSEMRYLFSVWVAENPSSSKKQRAGVAQCVSVSTLAVAPSK